MAREIRLEKGHENEAILYNNINKNRECIKEIIDSGYVNIGEHTHHKKKGPRGWDLYNSVSSVMKKVIGYKPKSGEKLSKVDLKKLDITYKRAETYGRKVRA